VTGGENRVPFGSHPDDAIPDHPAASDRFPMKQRRVFDERQLIGEFAAAASVVRLCDA
jgi:hypothetical protein